jgi:sugar phosphate isomerase/epimerase
MTISTPYSFQLYSSRKFPPLADQLKTLAGLGYTSVEPFGGLYDDVKSLRAGLDATGLTAKSGHFGLEMLDSNLDGAVEIARTLGIGIVVCPYLVAELRPTDTAGWKALGARLQAVAAGIEKAGLRFAWHNHDFEFRALPDGSSPIEHILAEGVLWEADLAWVARADTDPAPWLQRYSGRIPLVHVKDIAPAGEKADEDGWADVGSGVLPWADLWQAAAAAGAEIMVAEHDNPSDFQRFARNSIATMSKLNGKV